MPVNNIYLRKLKTEDANENYLSWFDEENKSIYIEYSKKKEINIDDLRNYISIYNNKKSLLLGIFEKGTNIHIGNIKYDPISIKNKYAVLGVFIGLKSFRGKGLFSKIFYESKKILCENYNICNICLKVSSKNKPAIRAYEKEKFISITNNCNNFFNNINKNEIAMVYELKK